MRALAEALMLQDFLLYVFS